MLISKSRLGPYTSFMAMDQCKNILIGLVNIEELLEKSVGKDVKGSDVSCNKGRGQIEVIKGHWVHNQLDNIYL